MFHVAATAIWAWISVQSPANLPFPFHETCIYINIRSVWFHSSIVNWLRHTDVSERRWSRADCEKCILDVPWIEERVGRVRQTCVQPYGPDVYWSCSISILVDDRSDCHDTNKSVQYSNNYSYQSLLQSLLQSLNSYYNSILIKVSNLTIQIHSIDYFYIIFIYI
jgi:hypothetical protein